MSHQHHKSTSRHSQEQKYRRIEHMRKTKRWLRKTMIVVIAVLVVAIVLSYFFITKESEPQDMEIHKTLLDRI